MHISASCFLTTPALSSTLHLDSVDNLVGVRDGDCDVSLKKPRYQRRALTLGGRVLDSDTDDLSVVNDDSTSLESGSTEESLGVKDETGSGTESSLVISNYSGVSFDHDVRR